MNRVQGPNRLARKRLTGSIDNLWGDPQDLPVSSSGGEVGAPVSSIGFRQFFERHRTQQYSVAFNQLRISRHAGPTFHLMPVQEFTACRSKISRQSGQDFTEQQAGSF